MEALGAARERKLSASLRGLRTLSGLGARGTGVLRGVRPIPRPLARDASQSRDWAEFG